MSQTSETQRSFAIRSNIFLLRLTRNWVRVALVIIGIYVSLPILAPVLMQVGATGPARVIYAMYGPFCHQFAFRSFFLFGEQSAYPRAIAGTDLAPFEAYAPYSPAFRESLSRYIDPANIDRFDYAIFSPALQFASRDFVGDERMGYKMTLCERDITIYIMLFTGGVIYSIPAVRRRLRPVPIWIYIILGLGPIGIDGFSQLLGYPPFNLWLPRETSPFFRVLTGGIFGLMNAWLGFPYLDMSFRETAEQIEAKLARAGIRV
jgi:uncharacterized membrane protein